MELLQLKYFLMVAKTEHMTLAAQQLNVSQPVLSKSINKLEDELGVLLFERVGRRIQLNDAGKTFQKAINNVIKMLDYSIKEVQNLEKEGTYEINIQIEAIATLSTKLLCAFAEQYPNVRFKLEQNENGNTWDSKKEIDLIITSSRKENTQSNGAPLFSEEIALGVPIGHPLSRYDSVQLSQIESECFIDRREGNNFRKLTDSFFRDAGICRNIAFECDSPHMVIQLIQGGLGIGFVGTKAVKAEGIKLLRVEDVKCERFIELHWPENRYRNQGVRDFIIFAQKYFEKYR